MSTSCSSDRSSLDSPAPCSSSDEHTQYVFVKKVGPESRLRQSVSMSGPYIEIVEQPQRHARFRYSSEGEHGYLYGEKATRTLPTYPTVRLVNYKGEAHIRCELYQYEKDEKHPHQLRFHKQESQIDYFVPVDGTYTVYFEKLSFINKSTKSFTKELRAQYLNANPSAREKEVNKYCKNVVQGIDFKRVRLRFSAHDVHNDEEICHAYSTPILNSKNPDTNKLCIKYVTKTFGSARGNDETVLLVEKINNKHTKVRFVDAEGWSATAHPIYNHHQIAIVCSIPPYKDQKIRQDVHVFIELYRETDGETSNQIRFKYIGRPHLAIPDRKRTATHVTSVGDTSDQPAIKIKKSISSPQLCEQPISQRCRSPDLQRAQQEIAGQVIPQCVAFPGSAQNDLLVDLTGQSSDTDSGIQENGNDLPTYIADILSFLKDKPFESLMQCSGQSTTEIRFPEHSLEDENGCLLRNDPMLSAASSMPSFTARPTVTQPNDIELFTLHYQGLHKPEYFGLDSIDDMPLPPFQDLMPDSEQRKDYKDSEIETPRTQSAHIDVILASLNGSPTIPKSHQSSDKISKTEKIKKLLQDIINLINWSRPRSVLQKKLEILFELDFPNGDSFLHLTLNQPIFFVLARVLYATDMIHLLNKANDLYQTVLHLAVLNELDDVVQMLISKGCDPMLADVDGNNALHLAVTSFSTLAALLDAMAVNKVPYNVNATNYEDQTALHLATINGCDVSLRLLLKYGADVTARDNYGRTALHLAACYDRAEAMSVLLDYTDADDVNVTDSRGHTALQTACDSNVRENTLAVVKLLLEAKVDPTKCEGNTVSAVKLARRHPKMRQILLRYQEKSHLEDSDDDDDYHTADEGENEDCIASKLQDLTVNE